ncbi:MAG: hypothetical protein JWR19_2324 [Pedosphaera sp.]|nr:hypothetical protein [Pedosphaera sp.]
MSRPKWIRLAVRVARILVLAYLGLILIVFLAQRRMLYHPGNESFEALTKVAEAQGFQPWQNASGQYIGWKQLSKISGPHDRILLVHGNAGSAIDRTYYAEGLGGVEACDIYLLEYPGFGARSGSPSQDSLFAAANEAMTLLEKDGPVYLIGESLGTGVAAYLAGTHPQTIAAVLLVAPFHNMTDVAQQHMPIFPVRWLLKDKFTSASYLQNYHGPVAVVLAELDQVIPNHFGRELFDAYAGPKKVWMVPHGMHGSLPGEPGWWETLVGFWKLDASQVKPATR